MNRPTLPEYRIQAFWGGRPADERACALRLATMLRILENGPPALRRWYRLGMTRRASSVPLLPVPDGRHGLIEFMKAGRHLMENIGSHIATRNGLAERDEMSFSGTVGAPQHPINRRIAGIFQRAFLRSIRLRRDCPGPAGGIAREGEGLGSALWPRLPRGRAPSGGRSWCRSDSGWLVYLAPFLARHVTPPFGIAFETTPHGGLIMIATENRCDPANPTHLAAVEAIQAALAPIQESP